MLVIMIYFAALQNVPSSLVESASLDGANAWQRPRHIIIQCNASVHCIVF